MCQPTRVSHRGEARREDMMSEGRRCPASASIREDEMDDKVVCGRIGGASSERVFRVDWHSLLDQLPYDFPDDPLEYDSFAETKDYVSERLDYFIERLSEIAG